MPLRRQCWVVLTLEQMLQPRYTMHGFEWQDKRGVEGTGFVRALRSLLTAHLPILLPKVKGIIQSGFAMEIQGHSKVDGLRRDATVMGSRLRLAQEVRTFEFSHPSQGSWRGSMALCSSAKSWVSM